MNNIKILFIVEELGDITTSGAIVNFNLCKLLARKYPNPSILTLDSVSKRVIDEWSSFGSLFIHPKNNLKTYQKRLLFSNKLKAFIFLLTGNDFQHKNRIKYIRKFLDKNIDKFDKIFLLSGGFGFTPHQSIKKKHTNKNIEIISVFHDPYPLSAYPEPYNKGSKIREFFYFKNLQRCLNFSDKIIFPSSRLYEWYLRDYKIKEKKVFIVPHAVGKKSVANKITISNDKLTISHTGTLLKQRNPEVFLKIFKKMKSKNIFLNFYGKIDRNVFRKISKFSGEKNITILQERITYQSSLNILHNSDFLLLIESNGKESPFLPTKFVDYVNCKKPIIILSSKNSEVSRLVGSNYPFITERDDEEGIYNMLTTKINDSLEVKNSIKIIEKLKIYFSEETILHSYDNILK